jgi:hypothetical protein
MNRKIILMRDLNGNNLESFNNVFEIYDKYGIDPFDVKKSIGDLEVNGLKYIFVEKIYNINK